MLHSQSRWIIQNPADGPVQDVQQRTGLTSIAAKFLVQRGFETDDQIRTFLKGSTEHLHDPFLMKDMHKAVDRIHTAVSKKERILVFGDYDADGVTSTSLLYSALTTIGAEAAWYVPNRFTEGYGPNEPAFRQAAEEGVTLIITVDTGISGVNEAEAAKSLGVDLIITDHHEPPPVIPDGFAVINPKQEDCGYPFKELAGVGVAFKLANALLGRLPEEFFDLTAVGTIADLVPLEDENRILASKGLQSMQDRLRPGLKALLQAAGTSRDELDEETIGFVIGPRLNAAGRLDSADPAVELLLTQDPGEAEETAGMIDALNRERQELVKEIASEAEKKVEEQGVPPVIVVAGEGWNPGVIGIVASRLVERFYRPAIVLSLLEDGTTAKGSARSIEGFDMFQSLSKFREILPHFGGHPMAAGLTMQRADIDQLRSGLIQTAEETLKADDYLKKIHVDLEVSVDEISVKTIQDLAAMAPFGMGNPAPKILIRRAVVEQAKVIGSAKDHLKLTLTNKDHSSSLDLIAFRMGAAEKSISPLAELSAVGKLSINEWNGRVKPQMIVEDLRIDDWQLFDHRGSRQYLSKQKEPRVLLHFSESAPADTPQAWKTVCCKDPDQAAPELSQAAYVTLYDTPDSMDQLRAVMQHLTSLEQLDAVFHDEQDYFFSPAPSRDQFKWYYAFLQKRGSFDMNENIKKLAAHKGWSESMISFMSNVFFELGFVKINGGVVSVNERPEKRDLSESELYTTRLEKTSIQQELCYSTYRSLKKQLDEMTITASVETHSR
ncbi:single-stranded-DNA-specific exonuclease RecJ [Alkalicoccus luteus]|uniref:Single-stranded-DNA-specific exonuclease RecJ n=1 Tax=Alkalicoccus luteus TaxID=1237094 RepID=A0A969TTR7_9BACI|nr:single-stranded-DNA-specific exonuclease RecJ [Alkalicoccus luteus]NJP36565.1 single-stranded-DNA-specific exonuclease RecJ [Alkalicoccus luteus]